MWGEITNELIHQVINLLSFSPVVILVLLGLTFIYCFVFFLTVTYHVSSHMSENRMMPMLEERERGHQEEWDLWVWAAER